MDKIFEPRPKQHEVLRYREGKMGVSAVPGSGKTHTLSLLAAELIASGTLDDDQEVLVVTLVNSAVDHFAHRVASFVKQRGLVPQIGYRVRTLHGLAHDIVRERPELAQVSEGFQIVDERAAEQILRGASEAWLRGNPEILDTFISLDIDEKRVSSIRNRYWPMLVSSLAANFIRQAKDLQLAPDDIRKRLDELEGIYPLLEMGWAVYTDYQRALQYRGSVDFDDLITKALQALRSDPVYLERLRARWPYILEDEAQDSSKLQEDILRLLVGPEGNWVRVGDPNQAIFETFTTASPQFLRDFLKERGVEARELPNSGRSTESIISLANHLIDWTKEAHPNEQVRSALSLPHIEPTPLGDPQPNPRDNPAGVRLIGLAYTPAEEITAVGKSLSQWLPDHQDRTVAVLVPTNHRGFQVVAELKRRGLPYLEILQSSRSTRETAGALTLILKHLSDPTSPRHLEKAFWVWNRQEREDEKSRPLLEQAAGLLRKCRHTEAFLWPRPDRDWLCEMELPHESNGLYERLDAFRSVLQRWHRAALLPIGQLVLTLAQDLFTEPVDLAMAYKLAMVLRRVSDMNPSWQIPELYRELEVIAKNERRFLGLSQDDIGFDPEQHRGEVVVATVHKAKGLEWDRVYILSVNNYDFPSAQAHDSYIAEKWFVRDQLNLGVEALAQLKNLNEGKSDIKVIEGEPTEQARLEYAAERIRLLYVALTRAKEDLILTWNTGRQGDKLQATPFIALQSFWDEQHNEPTE